MKHPIQIYLSKMAFPAIAILFSAIYLKSASELAAQDVLLVKPIAMILICIASISAVLDFRKIRVSEDAGTTPGVSPRVSAKVLLFILSCFVYLGILTRVGFLPSTVLFLGVVSFFLGVRNKKTLVAVPLFVTFFLYFIFQVLLEVPLPPGILSFLN